MRLVLYSTLLLIGCLAVTSARKRAPSGIRILDGICMPRRADRLVYRHRNDTDIYVAFDILKKGKVHVYSWDILNAERGTFISSMKSTVLPAVDFRKTVNRNHILGSCGKANYKKFKNRLLRKMKRCDRPKKLCKIADIISVVTRLKMRNVKFNKADDDECDL